LLINLNDDYPKSGVAEFEYETQKSTLLNSTFCDSAPTEVLIGGSRRSNFSLRELNSYSQSATPKIENLITPNSRNCPKMAENN